MVLPAGATSTSEATDEGNAIPIENIYHSTQPNELPRFAKSCNGTMPYMGTP